MTNSLQLIPLSDFPLVEPGDDLSTLILNSLSANNLTLEAGDLLVIAQKIISKAENRYARLSAVTPGDRAKELAVQCDKDPRLVELILSESTEVLRIRPGVIIVEHKLGYVHANAGIDRSNIPALNDGNDDDEQVLLLPLDADKSAHSLRVELQARGSDDIKIIINDSAGRAWRNGTVGFTIGSAGFAPIVDMVGSNDLFQRRLEVTEVAVADELAAAASFLMGQADEGVPVVLVRGAKLQPSQEGSVSMVRDKSMDLFR